MCSVQPQDRSRRIQFNRKTNEPNRPPPALTPADSGAASWRRRSHGDGAVCWQPAQGEGGWGRGEREPGRGILQGMGPKGSLQRLLRGGPLGRGCSPPHPQLREAGPLSSAHLLFQPPQHSRSHLFPWLTTQVGDSQHLPGNQGRGGHGSLLLGCSGGLGGGVGRGGWHRRFPLSPWENPISRNQPSGIFSSRWWGVGSEKTQALRDQLVNEIKDTFYHFTFYLTTCNNESVVGKLLNALKNLCYLSLQCSRY